MNSGVTDIPYDVRFAKFSIGVVAVFRGPPPPELDSIGPKRSFNTTLYSNDLLSIDNGNVFISNEYTLLP